MRGMSIVGNKRQCVRGVGPLRDRDIEWQRETYERRQPKCEER